MWYRSTECFVHLQIDPDDAIDNGTSYLMQTFNNNVDLKRRFILLLNIPIHI